MTQGTTTRGTALDARYGRTPGRRRRGRLIAVLAGAGVLLVVTAWVVWAGPLQPGGAIETRDVSYTVVDDETVTVRWELTVPAGDRATCAVQALDGNHGIVGWRVVDVPPGEQRTRQFQQDLRTSAPAVTGLLWRCWLP